MVTNAAGVGGQVYYSGQEDSSVEFSNFLFRVLDHNIYPKGSNKSLIMINIKANMKCTLLFLECVGFPLLFLIFYVQKS